MSRPGARARERDRRRRGQRATLERVRRGPRSRTWFEYHPDVRVSYYLFLRAVYGLTASQALARVRDVHDRGATVGFTPRPRGAS